MSHKGLLMVVWGSVVGGGNKKKPTNEPYSSLVGERGWCCGWLEGPASCVAMKGEPTNKPYSSLVGGRGWRRGWKTHNT